jgi:DNA-binding NarL/FixJ family response regulator
MEDLHRQPESRREAMTNTLLDQSERPRAGVVLVDDNPLVREHLKALLEAEKDLTVCGEADDAPAALAVIGQHRPHLVILDISLKHSNGLDLLKDLSTFEPRPAVLVLTMHDEVRYAERALEAGAGGYITKEEATANILLAVRKVLAGEAYMSERLAKRLMQKQTGAGAGELGSPLELLTDREWEVFRGIGQGMPCQQIARQLGVRLKTVEAYQARIGEKLNLSDREQLRERATQWAQQHLSCGFAPAARTKANRTPALACKALATEGPPGIAREAGFPPSRSEVSSGGGPPL